MIRAGHTSYAAAYHASSTWRRARRREQIRAWTAYLTILGVLAVFAAAGVWGFSVVLAHLPVMTN